MTASRRDRLGAPADDRPGAAAHDRAGAPGHDSAGSRGTAVPLRVHAAFTGCKVSQADSEAVLERLATRGCRAVGDPAEADVQVVLTCAVTGEAERSSRQLARRLAAHGRPVVVAGCAAALRPEQFAGAGVALALADAGRAAGVEAVARRVLEAGGEPWATFVGAGDPTAAPAGDDRPSPMAARGIAAGGRTRFTLKVQDGCAGRCSYCAVRLVRGHPWSLAADSAVERARAAVAAGCGEIVLSGIDVGAYRDPAGGGLAALVGRLTRLPGLARLRLSSIEPRHLTAELIEALADPLVARHLHVPLQSADDGVLAAMGRPYTWRQYQEIVAGARRRLPGLALSTDLIVGFPTEDDTAFARSLSAIGPGAGLFGRVHVFSYSPRAGTQAAALAPAPAATVKARARLAREAAAAARSAAAAASLNAPARVLLEEYRDGVWRGYSSTYVRYYLKGAGARGRMVGAVAEALYRDGVKGRLA
jgi:threonylcarbamoyladenosine tRNA methylthiotransferase MtaB